MAHAKKATKQRKGLKKGEKMVAVKPLEEAIHFNYSGTGVRYNP